MRTTLAASWALCALTLLAARPQVTNISVQPASRRAIAVSYQLDQPAIVTLEVLTNGAPVALSDLLSLEGDVNRYVTSSGNHAFTWRRPHKDIPEGSYTVKYVLTAWATNAPPDYMVVDINPAKVSYYASADAIPGGITNWASKTSRIVFRKIPAAGVEWGMGSSVVESSREAIREVPHLVTLTEDFYLAIFETTQSQCTALGLALSSDWRWKPSNTGYDEVGDLPMAVITYTRLRGDVENDGIDWPATGHDVAPTSALQSMRDRTGVALDLPTDAQWEFACRAGCPLNCSNWAIYNTDFEKAGWIRSNSATMVNGESTMHPHPVGTKQPNDFGLYDMHGNMTEWCLDWIDANRPFAPDPVTDPKGFTSGTGRVTRSGNYSYEAALCRSGRRGNDQPGVPSAGIGFRLACPAAAFTAP